MGEDFVTSFTFIKQADFITLELGDNPSQELQCKNPTAGVGRNIAASYLTQRVGLGCTSEPENLAKVPHLVYAVNVNNSRATTSLVVQLEEISVLTENQKLTLILRSKNPVEWKIISDFANPIHTQLEFVIGNGSTANIRDLKFAHSPGTILHSNLIADFPFNDNYPHPQLTAYGEFEANVNFLRVRLKRNVQIVPKQLNSDQIYQILQSYIPTCTPDLFCLNLTMTADLKQLSVLLREVLTFGECSLSRDNDVLYLRAKPGSCGVTYDEDKSQFHVMGHFVLQKG
uniref:Uncharacterized protein n=1 Tax=Ciona savignyi TaxID=51511 RepID=H2Z7U3_CIOSA